MNIVIDDASPQIRYLKGDSLNVGWIVEHTTKSKYADGFTDRYSESTFHGTFSEGDYMEYRFNGTGITVYGAKRPNHGVYGVKIDDSPEERYDGAGKDIFQATLYQKMGLDEKVEHVIRMTNYPSATPDRKGDLWFDVDHIIITHTIPSTMYTTYIDDSSPLVKYDPSWVSYGYGTGGYYNLTDHMSPTTDSSMEFKFNGSSIQLYDGVNADHGDYTISLDGGDEEVYNANNWQMVYQVPLYTASGLPEGQHTIKMTNRGVSPENVLGFDFAIVNSSVKPPETDSTGGNAGISTSSAASSPITSSSSTGSSGAFSASGAQLNIGALAGGIAGGVVLIALLIVLLIWFCRRRKVNREDEKIEQYYSEGYTPGNPSTGRIDLLSNSATSPSEASGQNIAWSTGGALAGGNMSPNSLRDRKRNYGNHQYNLSSSNSNSNSNSISQSLSQSNGSPISPMNDFRNLNQNHPFLQDIQHSPMESEPISSTSASSSPYNYASPISNMNNSPISRSNNHQRFNTLTSNLSSSSSPSEPYPHCTSPVSTSNAHSNRTLPHTFESPISTSDESGTRSNNNGIHSHSAHGGSGSGSRSGNEPTTRIRDMYNNPLPHSSTHAGPTPPYSRQNSESSPVSPPRSIGRNTRKLDNTMQPDDENDLQPNGVSKKEGGGFAWG